MANDPTQIAEILHRGDSILATARHGLSDTLDKGRSRRMSGLHNAIVFGRSVSFVLQNLKSVVDDFDEWYGEEQKTMKSDPVLKFMVDTRNEILKQGKLKVDTHAFVASFSSDDMKNPPPGATGFFIGDELGGSGWMIQMPDGTSEKYYVEMPENFVVTQCFSDLSTEKYPELVGRSVDELVTEYVEKMAALLQRARARFMPVADGRGRSHLRLVKG